MKNVQVIDGAINCTYDVYAFPDDAFEIMFPEPDQDVEFFEDYREREGKKISDETWKQIWKSRVEKRDVIGIHGTLFYELRDQKKKFYPNKKESDMDLTSWIDEET